MPKRMIKAKILEVDTTGSWLAQLSLKPLVGKRLPKMEKIF